MADQPNNLSFENLAKSNCLVKSYSRKTQFPGKLYLCPIFYITLPHLIDYIPGFLGFFMEALAKRKSRQSGAGDPKKNAFV